MKLHHLHNWDVSLEEAARLQRALRERLVLQPPEHFAPRYAAGSDVATSKYSPVAYAGFVVVDMETWETVAAVTAVTEVTFPYVPGFLSFREIPALAEAWQKLEVMPDVLVVDGQGTAHPRRMGLACHAGLVFGLPTLGCAKSLLTGKYEELADERGATAPLLHRGETVGMAVRTRTNVSPVFVSPGHLMNLSTAVALTFRLTPEGKYRLPETTRRAHKLVNELYKREQG